MTLVLRTFIFAIALSFGVHANAQKPLKQLPPAECVTIVQEGEEKVSTLRRFAIKTGILAGTLGAAAGLTFFVPENLAIPAGIVTGVALSSMAQSFLGPLSARLGRESWKLEHGKKAEIKDPDDLDNRYRALNAVYDLNRQNAIDHMSDNMKETRRLFSEIAMQLLTKDKRFEELAYDAMAEYIVFYRYYREDIPPENKHIVKVIHSRLRKIEIDTDRVFQKILELEAKFDPKLTRTLDGLNAKERFELENYREVEYDKYRKIIQAWLARR